MTVQDRTQEFQHCVASLARSNQNTIAARQRQQNQQQLQQSTKRGPKSEFSLRASRVAGEIANTTDLLGKLATLARKKTLFDDRPVEFQELAVVIKQKLKKINDSLLDLKKFQQKQQNEQKSAWGANNKSEQQLHQHSKNVVEMLQTKLGEAATGYTRVLEERTQNLQESKSRTEQFMSSTSQAAAQNGQYASDSPLYSKTTQQHNSQTPQHQYTNSANPYLNTALQSENPYGQSEYLSLPNEQQAVLLEEQQDHYLQERATAVETIESTIQELGGIFQSLSSLVAEQQNVIQRIDANTEDISMNVVGAQREILKYYARISSNRWLFIKMFGIVLFFFFIWVLVS